MFKNEVNSIYYRASLNNEIMRLVWASYKEGYFKENSDVFFIVLNVRTGETYKISSRQEALEFQYTQYFKGHFKIAGHFGDETICFESTNPLLNRILPELKKRFLDRDFSPAQWEKLLLVSEDAVKNEELAVINKQYLDSEIGSLIDYGLTLTANESFIFFCRYAAYFGRFDMPFSKMKLPIENKQSLEFAPEFGNEVLLIATALHRDYAFVNSPEGDPNIFIVRENPELYREWQGMLVEKNLLPSDYLILPVHPLSLDLYRQRLSELIDADLFVIDTSIGLSTKAALSYRTVIPNRKESSLVYKLPVPMQLTGFMRFICWEEIVKSPQFSQILDKIFKKERDFGGRIRLDRDIAAFSVHPKATTNIHGNDPNYMSCIIRENQSRDIPKGYLTMPLAMLFASFSTENVPFFIQVMRWAGIQSKDDAIRCFKSYLNINLRSIFTLYLRNGLMLEAHQQNIGITLKPGGAFHKLHYHDVAFAVHTYSKVYLAAGHDPDLLDGLPDVSDQITKSARLFISCVLMLNLFPVASIVAHYFSIEERDLLKLIADEIHKIIETERQKLWQKPKDLQDIFVHFYDNLEERILKVPSFDTGLPLGRFFRVSQFPGWGEVPNKNDITFNKIKMTDGYTHNPLAGLTSIS